MRFKGIRRQLQSWEPFDDDKEFLHLIDIIGHTYGILPSEVMKLSWEEIIICGKCFMARGARIKQITRTQKKTMIFPTMDISSLADILG